MTVVVSRNFAMRKDRTFLCIKHKLKFDTWEQLRDHVTKEHPNYGGDPLPCTFS